MAAPWNRSHGTWTWSSLRKRRRQANWTGVVGPWVLGLALAGGFAAPAAAGTLSVGIDTSALVGAKGRLDFALLDGDFTPNNSVTISNLVTNGMPPTTLTAPTTIDDSTGFGQFLWDFTVGTSISFDLSFTTLFDTTDINSAPDRFTVNLLDADTDFTLVDTDLDFLSDPVPAQDALLIVDLAGDGLVQRPTTSDPTTPVSAVPEPGTLAIAALGLLALTARRMRRPSFIQ